ncbi:hypothetical protein NLG97_g5908 [Lecanicillium saksenae]|uniref:Uncharacterized protein n=1 Tax=Lecanicillium saksenae TaxID=468837 RepID=A0ACC1QR56_9HYPO|nr:hypothetical protein NLG97_g5908 [Lecanicillium saksenae]
MMPFSNVSFPDIIGRDDRGCEDDALKHWKPMRQALGEIEAASGSCSDDPDEFSCGTMEKDPRFIDKIVRNGRELHRLRDSEWCTVDEMSSVAITAHYHEVIATNNNSFIYAPIRNPERVLFIGVGDGMAAIDVAERFPMASVWGIDTADNFIMELPPNCSLQMDVFEPYLTFASDFFDYVHINNVNYRVEDLATLYSEARRVLKPGGCVEHSETVVTVGTAAWNEFSSMRAKAAAITRKQAIGYWHSTAHLERAEFQNVGWARTAIPATAFSCDIEGRVLPALEPLRLSASYLNLLVDAMAADVMAHGAAQFATRGIVYGYKASQVNP